MNILGLYVLTVILGVLAGFISKSSKEDKKELFWILLHAVFMLAIAVCTIIAYVSIKGIV